MRRPTVRFGPVLTAKLAVRLVAELAQARIRLGQADHDTRRHAGELSALDRDMFVVMAVGVVVLAVQLSVIGRWIATGRGPGVLAVVVIV